MAAVEEVLTSMVQRQVLQKNFVEVKPVEVRAREDVFAAAVEVIRSGTTKCTALQWLCSEHLQLESDGSGVIAFGDGSNDNDMLEWAERSYTPQNANLETQRYAKAVLQLSCDEDAVAGCLESLAQELKELASLKSI